MLSFHWRCILGAAIGAIVACCLSIHALCYLGVLRQLPIAVTLGLALLSFISFGIFAICAQVAFYGFFTIPKAGKNSVKSLLGATQAFMLATAYCGSVGVITLGNINQGGTVVKTEDKMYLDWGKRRMPIHTEEEYYRRIRCDVLGKTSMFLFPNILALYCLRVDVLRVRASHYLAADEESSTIK